MNIKFKINQKIKIGGKEYSSPEEMPPDVRAIYDRALAGGLINQASAATPKITFNGQTYERLDDMPDEVRKIYNDISNLVEKNRESASGQIQSPAFHSSDVNLANSQHSQVRLDGNTNSGQEWLLRLILFVVLLVLVASALLIIYNSR